MRNRLHAHASLASQLKHLVVDLFRLDMLEPDTIADHAPLLESLGLDSLDALELAFCIEEEFGITIGGTEESQNAFASIASLVAFIQARVQFEVTPSRDLAVTPTPRQVVSSPSAA